MATRETEFILLWKVNNSTLKRSWRRLIKVKLWYSLACMTINENALDHDITLIHSSLVLIYNIYCKFLGYNCTVSRHQIWNPQNMSFPIIIMWPATEFDLVLSHIPGSWCILWVAEKDLRLFRRTLLSFIHCEWHLSSIHCWFTRLTRCCRWPQRHKR